MSPQNTVRIIAAGVILLVLIIAGASATYIVPPGHRGVLVTLGKVSPGFKSEGFGVKTPFISEVFPIPIKQRSAEMKAAVISKDLQEVRTVVRVLYRVPESSVVQIYRLYKGDPFLSLIQPRVDEALKEITKEHTAEQIVQGRAAIKKRTLASARQKIGELLTVVDVVVEDISLSSNLETAIERKMVQEQEANKAIFEQEKAQIDAQIAVVRAKGEAESIRIRGKALADNPELIDLEIVSKWNGRAPKAVGGNAGGAAMLLPLAPEKPSRTVETTNQQASR